MLATLWLPLLQVYAMEKKETREKRLTESRLEGHVELEEDCTSRFGLSSSIYARHEDALLEAHTDVIRGELAKNRAEARKLALLEMGEEGNNENAIAEVPVSFDGTWSRRGYSANLCVSSVISAASGKVLDFEVISKVCSQCNQKKANCTQEAFEDWL
ncbi:hypothetical protein AWC38_SpisGene22927 [Stylophora pistillata]|uniref:Mutator-like transposase domain-containing protein n=1 Tax=Stylophora pistillata TaxID=50429 RepID=A0A2B4R9S3_STYPI|nr:hypothetical protein AWC38_SpisGene22927 [Stylophora pistillata]